MGSKLIPIHLFAPELPKMKMKEVLIKTALAERKRHSPNPGIANKLQNQIPF